ncbi:branched-chain-amino-acid aminotransferas-like protein [Patellaria atrata CBS 101060]|uniref:Branched-chain-amino-acid aminotransferase n=1 Tax=Patellaria atrata CBS 101060 TaxID=1346257 RepID=A0A9P4VT89_9PEZI|nr:branched-chain-amino-acid aminotransferas-like protein [Patellaria atrata CBS 101060]
MSPSAIPIEGSSDLTTTELTNNGITSSLSTSTSSALPNGVEGVSTPLPELDASLLRITFSQTPKLVPEPNSPEIMSMQCCTDHMITCQWTLNGGWQAPHLHPYGPLSLMPTASVLHYATECFEGMKLYRGYDGKLRLFRPNLNCARMLLSSTRIALPGFPPEELLKLVEALCARDGPKWLPKKYPGRFLYVRPTMIANDPALGVQKPKEALLYIILTCFPDLASSSPNIGMNLLASQDDMVRAWPGGFGYAKVGANYGPSLLAQGEAKKKGYHQILWLFGEKCEVTEAGASNFFVVWKTKEGELELVTAPLHGRIILDGVTRRSVLELARQRLISGYYDSNLEIDLPALKIMERKFYMHEMVEAAREGRLVEALACGTAFFIAPVQMVTFRGEDYKIPMGKDGMGGMVTTLIRGWLKGIMYGKEQHEWGHIIEEEEHDAVQEV